VDQAIDILPVNKTIILRFRKKRQQKQNETADPFHFSMILFDNESVRNSVRS